MPTVQRPHLLHHVIVNQESKGCSWLGSSWSFMFDATNRHGLNSWYFNVLPCHQACNKLLQSGKSASRRFETVTTDTGALRLWGVSRGMFGGQCASKCSHIVRCWNLPQKHGQQGTPTPVPHPHQSLEGKKKTAMALVPAPNWYFFAEMSKTIKAYYEAVESPLACMMLTIVSRQIPRLVWAAKNTERLWKPLLWGSLNRYLKLLKISQVISSIANLSTPPGKSHHFFPKHIYTHRIHAWYIYLHEPFNLMVHVGKYTIHGWYGMGYIMLYPSSFLSSWAKLLQSSIEFKRIKRGGGPACAKTPRSQCV